MRKQIHSILLLMPWLLVSCQPEPLDTIISPSGTRMVVNSFTTADGTLWISLTRSNGVLGKPSKTINNEWDLLKQLSIEDAIVTLSGNNKTDTLAYTPEGFYQLPKAKLIAGLTYQLTAHRPATGETVLAFSTVPERSNILSYRLLPKPALAQNSRELELTFEDGSLYPNFYTISCTTVGPKSAAKSELKQHIAQRSTALTLTDDKNEDQGTISVIQEIPSASLTDSVIFIVSPVEVGYFRFCQQLQQSGNVLSQLAGDVIRYQSNIQGGYGYFSLTLPAIVRIPANKLN